jgi:hypothetical protein
MRDGERVKPAPAVEESPAGKKEEKGNKEGIFNP